MHGRAWRGSPRFRRAMRSCAKIRSRRHSKTLEALTDRALPRGVGPGRGFLGRRQSSRLPRCLHVRSRLPRAVGHHQPARQRCCGRGACNRTIRCRKRRRCRRRHETVPVRSRRYRGDRVRRPRNLVSRAARSLRRAVPRPLYLVDGDTSTRDAVRRHREASTGRESRNRLRRERSTSDECTVLVEQKALSIW